MDGSLLLGNGWRKTDAVSGRWKFSVCGFGQEWFSLGNGFTRMAIKIFSVKVLLLSYGGPLWGKVFMEGFSCPWNLGVRVFL